MEGKKFSVVFSHSAQREIEELEIQDALQLARDTLRDLVNITIENLPIEKVEASTM